jgi:CheY-like chemotaxis protein
MILFLDDNKYRTKTFKSNVPQATTTETAEGMIALLKNCIEPVDVLYLDHDLGGKEYVSSSDKDCGMEVVRWIIENKPIIAKIVVHTCNPSAGKEMQAKLVEAGYNTDYIPFTSLVEGFLAPLDTYHA